MKHSRSRDYERRVPGNKTPHSPQHSYSAPPHSALGKLPELSPSRNAHTNKRPKPIHPVTSRVLNEALRSRRGRLSST
ncbi:uncharacterized protein SCHCODRAFT_02376294 [Schizophyllum commune H4-8]|uniref:uncharacterized protein n=1 Tax=Schizophyllum commune (strain H4-8 / FGSC 9210) TaxID=578458 RepID=UPI00215FB188|nr:uncharacterized protein SCHCODRAFT_02376294 [Schizophyllum commune H4-8]KAI5889734.1 hypothetical protein SCHCODRAFT_02376294 [Schizophyllum commune H4-8]